MLLQTGNGTPGWPADVARTTTVIEEIVDGHGSIVMEIFQHVSVDPAPRDAPATSSGQGQVIGSNMSDVQLHPF